MQGVPMTQPRDYQRSTVDPISTLPAYDGELGARLTADGTAFTVWAPTAEAVTLRLFATGSDDEAGRTRHRRASDGVRPARHLACGDPGMAGGRLLRLLVAFPDGTVNRAADPWARAAGVNGARSMVVDLAQTNPDGWDDDRGPDIPDGELVVWETHIGDFSNDPDSGGARGTSRAVPGLHAREHPHPERFRIAHLPGPSQAARRHLRAAAAVLRLRFRG